MVDLFYDVKYLDETYSFIMWKQFIMLKLVWMWSIILYRLMF